MVQDIGIALSKLNALNEGIQVSISYGYFTYMPEMSLNRSELISLVDQRLFTNKKEKKKIGASIREL